MESEDYKPAFTTLAPYYDRLMSFVNYPAWVEYIEKILSVNNSTEKKIFDLACGTGSCLALWRKRGYGIIGLDSSLAMLMVGKEKLVQSLVGDGDDFLLINADMRNFVLAKKVPIITCLYDSLNYLIKDDELAKCFSNVFEQLSENGIFIFDMNTTHSLRDEWGNQTYYRHDGNMDSTWTNNYDGQDNISTLKLTITIQNDGQKMDLREIHQERAYALATIKNLLEAVGFKVSLYRHLTFNPAQETDLRIMGVARK